jgi:hypothetical protein
MPSAGRIGTAPLSVARITQAGPGDSSWLKPEPGKSTLVVDYDRQVVIASNGTQSMVVPLSNIAWMQLA